MADANKTQLTYGIESAWGTSPGTFTKLRFTGESLAFNITNITSNEIRSDRQVTDLIQTGADCSGGINFELSYGAFDAILEGALCSTWAGIGGASVDSIVTNSTKTITVNATNKTFTFSTGFTGSAFNLVKGQAFMFVTGDASNEGVHFVNSATARTFTVSTTTLTPALYDASPVATIKSSRLRNGDIEKSFSIERFVNRAVGDDFYFLFSGMMVNTLQITATASAIITGSLDFIGKVATVLTGSQDADTYAEAPANDVLNAVANVADIIEGATLETDLQAAGIYFQELAFTVANNLRGRQAIGYLGNVSVGLGRCDVNGTVTAYFDSKALYDKYVNATASGLSFSVEDASGKGYVFSFPKVKFSSDAINAEGINTDIMERLGFQAIRHPTFDYTIQICRFA